MSDVNKKSMVLITTPWRNGTKSFSLVPISQDCPYSEAFYDVDRKFLVIMGKELKDALHMVAKLDDNGDPELTKKPRPADQDGRINPYKEERRILPANREYIIINKEEIIEMVELMASNSNFFDFKKYLNESSIVVPETPSIIMP